jgi:hypothetical protein
MSMEGNGSGTSAGQGTFDGQINAMGSVTGFHADANNVYHGYYGFREPWARSGGQFQCRQSDGLFFLDD